VLGARDYQGGITILVAATFVSTSHQKNVAARELQFVMLVPGGHQ
jgi:hypothetical protein